MLCIDYKLQLWVLWSSGVILLEIGDASLEWNPPIIILSDNNMCHTRFRKLKSSDFDEEMAGVRSSIWFQSREGKRPFMLMPVTEWHFKWNRMYCTYSLIFLFANLFICISIQFGSWGQSYSILCAESTRPTMLLADKMVYVSRINWNSSV